MLWPIAFLRRPRNVEIERRVAQARHDHPESEAWLGLLEAALAESERGTWEALVPRPKPDRPVRAPLLWGAALRVEGRAARRWLRHLATRANGRGARTASPAQVDAVALLEAALCQDDARIEGLARSAQADPAAVRVVGQMAVLPLLRACARGLTADLPSAWWEGYCPVCGAWPVVAEYTGLERKRQLRCGRCSTGWAIPQLRCVFCDETNHENLGYLTPENGEEMRKIEICRTCRGYVKGLTTVRPLAPWAILLDDLATVHLDLAAIEREYARPERPGYALEAQVTAA